MAKNTTKHANQATTQLTSTVSLKPNSCMFSDDIDEPLGGDIATIIAFIKCNASQRSTFIISPKVDIFKEIQVNAD